MVDDEDFEWLNQWKWQAKLDHGNWYAQGSIPTPRRKTYFLHRLILGLSGGMIDHKNGNGLDCQRHNLRRCTNSQNMANKRIEKKNTSGFKGVGYVWKRWGAKITVSGKSIWLGMFDTKIQAARAHNEAALKYHGEFSRLNDLSKYETTQEQTG